MRSGVEQYQVHTPQPPQAKTAVSQPQEVMAMVQAIVKAQKSIDANMVQQFSDALTRIADYHNEMNCKFEALSARLQHVERFEALSARLQHVERQLELSFVKLSAQPPSNNFQPPKKGEMTNTSNSCSRVEHVTPTRHYRRAQPQDVQKSAVSKDFSKSSAQLPYPPPKPFLEHLTQNPTVTGKSVSINGVSKLGIKPLKHPKVVVVKSGKASDYCRKIPMFEEVVDGESLASLFACDETTNSPPKELNSPPKQLSTPPPLNLGPDIVLIPIGYVDGTMEYKVKSSKRPKPFAKVKQLLSKTKPNADWSGPFHINKVMPCGAITLVSKDGDDPPVNGQRVKLFTVAGTILKGSPPPLFDPP